MKIHLMDSGRMQSVHNSHYLPWFINILLDHPVPSSTAIMSWEAAITDAVGMRREGMRSRLFCLHVTHTQGCSVCYCSPTWPTLVSWDTHSYSSAAVWVEIQIWVSSVKKLGVKAMRADGITLPRITVTTVKARWDVEKERAMKRTLSKAEDCQWLPSDEGSGQHNSGADASHSQHSDIWAVIGGWEDRTVETVLEKSDSRWQLLTETAGGKCGVQGIVFKMKYSPLMFKCDAEGLIWKHVRGRLIRI